MLKHLAAVSLSLLISLPSYASDAAKENPSAPPPQTPAANAAAPMPMDFSQTVWKVEVAEGVSMDEAIESMKLRANTLNMKLVAHQPLSEELKAQGVPNVYRMEIFQFCDAQIAKKMVDYDLTFAAYLPCRIAAVTDAQGKDWLLTQNMDLVMGMASLSPELQALAKKVRDNIDSIIHAAAAGDI